MPPPGRNRGRWGGVSWGMRSYLTLVLAVAACGGARQPGAAASAASPMDEMMAKAMGESADDGSRFGPLEVGADWASYVKLNTEPVPSETHGGRLVDTYVNRIGAAAYLDDEAEIPVGTILVKTSREPDLTPGPLFVMEKKPPGFDPERGDWYYAIHWAEPPPAWRQRLGGPIYWRSPSKKAAYCWECHENYDRALGGVPGSKRITALPE